MRRRPPRPVRLSRAERRELDELVRDGHTEQRVARRARILLAMSDPETVVSDLAPRSTTRPPAFGMSAGASRPPAWTPCTSANDRGVHAS
ncbi:MAG: hypothetical protein M1570_13685 [Chloroflexi bacterium]|nr:hypothetical protein [Chloroflexota bacterium]